MATPPMQNCSIFLLVDSSQISQDMLNAKCSDNASVYFTDWGWISGKFSLRMFSHVSYWYSMLPLHQASKLIFFFFNFM